MLKSYVRNPTRPEACIAENYIAEEAIEFMSEFLPGLAAVGVPTSLEIITTDLVENGKHPSGAELIAPDSKALEQAHHYVLQNTGVVQPYIE